MTTGVCIGPFKILVVWLSVSTIRISRFELCFGLCLCLELRFFVCTCSFVSTVFCSYLKEVHWVRWWRWWWWWTEKESRRVLMCNNAFGNVEMWEKHFGQHMKKWFCVFFFWTVIWYIFCSRDSGTVWITHIIHVQYQHRTGLGLRLSLRLGLGLYLAHGVRLAQQRGAVLWPSRSHLWMPWQHFVSWTDGQPLPSTSALPCAWNPRQPVGMVIGFGLRAATP